MPMSEQHKAAMKAGRERATALRANGGSPAKGVRGKKKPPPEGARFSIDERGELTILDVDLRSGLTLDPATALSLGAFLNRCLQWPRDVALA